MNKITFTAISILLNSLNFYSFCDFSAAEEPQQSDHGPEVQVPDVANPDQVVGNRAPLSPPEPAELPDEALVLLKELHKLGIQVEEADHLDSVSVEAQKLMAEILAFHTLGKEPRLKKLSKGVGHFSWHMVRFFMAVAVLDAANCIFKNNPMECQAFWDSQQTAGPWIGYVFFTAASMGTSSAIRLLAKTDNGKYWLKKTIGFNRFLPLAIGHFANTIYSEIANSPEFKEYIEAARIQDPEVRWRTRKAALKKLWKVSLGSAKWWFDQGPDVAGLITASFISGKILTSLESGLQSFSKKASSTKGLGWMGKVAGTSAESIRNYKTYQLLKASMSGIQIKFAKKLGWIGFRIHPLIWFGLGTYETVQFLGFSHLVDEPISNYVNLSEALFNLGNSETDLHNAFLSPNPVPFEPEASNQPPLPGPKNVVDAILSVQRNWDQVRRVGIFSSLRKVQSYLYTLSKLDTPRLRIYYYYLWLMSGSSPKSPLWVTNPGGWHVEDLEPLAANRKWYEKGLDLGTQLLTNPFHLIRPPDSSHQEIFEMTHSFFCGPDPKLAIRESLDFHGIPIPGWINTTIEPYRVAPYNPGFCEPRIVTPFIYQMEQLTLTRKDWQKHFKFAYTTTELLMDPIRQRWVDRYDEEATRAVIRSLRGPLQPKVQGNLKIPSTGGDWSDQLTLTQLAQAPDGYLPTLDEEIEYWNRLSKQLPQYQNLFMMAITRANRIKDLAQEILDYYQDPDPEDKAGIIGFEKPPSDDPQHAAQLSKDGKLPLTKKSKKEIFQDPQDTESAHSSIDEVDETLTLLKRLMVN